MRVVSILGCGWLGKSVATDFIKQGYKVKGSTTSVAKIDELTSMGVQSFLIDISTNDFNTDFFKADVLLIAITSKSIDDFKRLIIQIEKSSVKKIIFISSTSVYSNTNTIVTEHNVTNNSPLASIEKLFIENTHLSTTILRFAGLFGDARNPANWFATKKIPQPNGFVNMIHKKDCVAIINKIIDENVFGEVFNACSNHHPTRKEFYTNARKNSGKKLPDFEG